MFWKVILHILVGYGAFMAGTFGFAQIVGSLQNIKSRGMKLCPSKSLLSTSAACQSKACVTTPLPIVSSVCFAAANPCFASPLPRPSVHILRVA